MTSDPAAHSDRPRRRQVSMAVLGAVLVLMLFTAPDVLLVIFAGLLFAVFFSAGGDPLGRRLGIGRGWGIGLFIVLVVLALTGAFLAFAPAAMDQFDQLTQEIPEAVEDVRSRIGEYAWGERLLERITPGRFVSEGGDVAATAVVSTFGAFGSFVVMLFIGLYVALAPDLYRRGVVALLAPSARKSGDQVLREAAATLRNWLVAQLMAMAVVGVLTWLGLWLVGVPLAPVLGLLAALLAFVPNIGPILSAIPAILLASSDGPTAMLMVVGVYAAVQTLESYVITPMIQQERVSLPPALIILMQLLMGVLFGLLGLALATPLAALGLAMVGETSPGTLRRSLPKPENPDQRAPHDPEVQALEAGRCLVAKTSVAPGRTCLSEQKKPLRRRSDHREQSAVTRDTGEERQEPALALLRKLLLQHIEHDRA